MMLTLDPFRLLPLSGAMVIDSEPTYIEARRQMLAYRLGTVKKAPAFVVHQPPYLAWFDDLPDDLLRRVSPRSELARQHPTVAIPVDLTDDDVQELNLLHDSIEPTRIDLFQHYFGALPEQATTKPETLLAVAQFVGQNPALFQKRYPAQLWKEYTTNLPDVLAPLRYADGFFCRALAEGIYVAGIPALLTDWEHSHATKFKTECGVKMSELLPFVRWSKRSFSDDPALEDTLARRLTALLKSGNNKPIELLPGLYRAELTALLAVTPRLTKDLQQSLTEKYADLLTPDLRRRLQTLVPLTLEPVPSLTGLSLPEQADAWQRWAVGSFIPYKFWLDDVAAPTLEQIDAVEGPATQYGDWLFNNAAALLANDSILTNYGVRERVSSALQTNNSRVVWLIIDGFPAAFTSLLEQQLRAHGLERQSKQYAFAALPTITEVGILALVNGLTADSSAYTLDRSEALNRAFPACKTAFAAVAGKFQAALDSNADLCCLHWQEIDKTLHRDDNEFDGPTARLETISELLNERLTKIVAAMNRQTDRPTKLIISTDHGATKCLRNGLNIKNAKITAAAAANPRERTVRLEGKLLTEHIDATETYHLTPDVTRNPVAYIAARGYRYFGSNDRGYRHGGLTPEETIVPVIIAEMAAFTVEPLQVSYYGSVDGVTQGKTLKNFGIQVLNRNAFAVKLLTVSVREDPNMQVDLPVTVGPGNSVTLLATIRIAQKYQPQNGQVSLAMTLTYRANADTITENTSLVVPIQTSEIDGFDFGDF